MLLDRSCLSTVRQLHCVFLTCLSKCPLDHIEDKSSPCHMILHTFLLSAALQVLVCCPCALAAGFVYVAILLPCCAGSVLLAVCKPSQMLTVVTYAGEGGAAVCRDSVHQSGYARCLHLPSACATAAIGLAGCPHPGHPLTPPPSTPFPSSCCMQESCKSSVTALCCVSKQSMAAQQSLVLVESTTATACTAAVKPILMEAFACTC